MNETTRNVLDAIKELLEHPENTQEYNLAILDAMSAVEFTMTGDRSETTKEFANLVNGNLPI